MNYEQGNEWKAKHLDDGYEKYWEFYDGTQGSISPTPGDETADQPGENGLEPDQASSPGTITPSASGRILNRAGSSVSGSPSA